MPSLGPMMLPVGLAFGLLVGPARRAPQQAEERKAAKTVLALGKICQAERGIAAEAFTRHLKRRHPRGWSIAVVAPATGSRLAAGELLSDRLGYPLFRVDMGMLVGKYIGETEKNLAKLLARAEVDEVILFFDEADALFGKRTDVDDANDRYADPAASTIPARLAEYDGLVLVGLRRPVDRAAGLRDIVMRAPDPPESGDAAKPGMSASPATKLPWAKLCWPPRPASPRDR